MSHHDVVFVHLKLIVIIFKKLDISRPSPGLLHFHVTADFSGLATQLQFLLYSVDHGGQVLSTVSGSVVLLLGGLSEEAEVPERWLDCSQEREIF